MKIGITGATGFLGSYLLEYFMRQQKYTIKALTRTIPLANPSKRGSVNWRQGDLGSVKTCDRFVRDLDVVVHLAHTNTPLQSNIDMPSDAMENMIPTLNLIQAIREQQRKPHIIYASSGGAVYGSCLGNTMFTESDTCMPASSYGIQKLAGEHYLRMAAQEGWLTATCLRIGNPYGVLVRPERMQGLIGVILHQLANREPISIFDNPENVRDYVHLEDMCRVFALVLSPKKLFDIFNVGTGTGYTVTQILQKVEKYSGQKIIRRNLALDPSFSRLPSWVILICTKAERELRWKASIDIDSGLKQLCKKKFKVS